MAGAGKGFYSWKARDAVGITYIAVPTPGLRPDTSLPELENTLAKSDPISRAIAW